MTRVDSTPCVLRHVRRTRPGETGVTVVGASFTAGNGAEFDALNGRSGWQAAEVTEALADNGSTMIRLPNTAGSDGILHRQRFALLTDPLYRIGEEWIEVYRGETVSPDNLVAVATPASWRLDRSALELRCLDLLGLLTLARTSELDLWHHAPRDVFDVYTRLPVATIAYRFDEWPLTPAYTDGWASVGAAPSFGVPGARIISNDIGGVLVAGELSRPLTGMDPDNFEVAASLHWESAPVANHSVGFTCAAGSSPLTFGVIVSAATGQANVSLNTDDSASGTWRARSRVKTPLPGPLDLRLIARGHWIYGFVNGELLVRARRSTIAAPTSFKVYAGQGNLGANATIVVRRVDVRSLRPFALRGAAKGDMRLPGVPDPGGLRGRYWNEESAGARFGYGSAEHASVVLDDLVEPSDSRLDATLSFSTDTFPWQPPSCRGAHNAFSARWTGAIYLDMSGNGRIVALATSDPVRVWIGRTLRRSDAVIDTWTNPLASRNSANLKTLLPEGTGWYPIVIEYAHLGAAASTTSQLLLLEGVPDVFGSVPASMTVVPASKLSPTGCYEAEHRNESHRELLDQVTQAAGFQWRVDPRPLESGEFPGQVIPRARVGADTDRVITGDESVELASEGDAADAVDRLLIDAAGIATAGDNAQLTADIVNDVADPVGRLFLSTATEALPEVTQQALLLQRADSLLALRSGPNEQVAARPTDLVPELRDSFPLTGALARRLWRPGDGLRLQLEELGVVDETPRQLMTVSTPYTPDGAGIPTVGWRQRPRGLRAFLKRTSRTVAALSRTPQGQLAKVTGTLGTVSGGSYGGNGGVDGYSRIALPTDTQPIEMSLVVQTYTLAAASTIEVNGRSTGITVAAAGRYPLTPWMERSTATDARTYARLISPPAGLNSEYSLELTVRI